jgi:hypothetical protein
MIMRNFDRVFRSLKFGWRLMIALSKDSIDEVTGAPWGGSIYARAERRDVTGSRSE